MTPRMVVEVAKMWGRTNLWLLRHVCNLRVEWRGLEKIPPGGLIIAAKHQSTWETFALLTILSGPVFILKRELMWIPVFGWCLHRGGMIPVDRGAGRAALIAMTKKAREAIAEGHQIIIFPRAPAARRAPRRNTSSASPSSMPTAGAVRTIALNSGLFWPRRRFLRFPGTVVVEVLDPIMPGRDRNAFFAELEEKLEAASTRLLDQGLRSLGEAGRSHFEAARNRAERARLFHRSGGAHRRVAG